MGGFGWRWDGRERPPFAERPGPDRESVWDYLRPPRVEPDRRRVVVRLGERVVADTVAALRVLETASAPSFYLPPGDVRRDLLEPAAGSSFCEWKGRARYWDVVVAGRRAERAAWSYPDPLPAFAALRDHLAFYPETLDCRVDGVRARPQPGGFYGGWVTPELAGPIKGAPGTGSW